MERRTDIAKAKSIMNDNFIGPEELDTIRDNLGIRSPFKISPKLPVLNFDSELLYRYSKDYLLILGIPTAYDNAPLTINKMRLFHGFNPSKREPCFYNQDWYLNESFANVVTTDFKWYLMKKDVFKEYRGEMPQKVINGRPKKVYLPSAVLCAYVFFAYYFHSKCEILWKNDFIWCADTDHNNDRIYVGRYVDPSGINKNGFNIHRHLSITKSFSYINALI